jgi:Fe-S-cluster containining protein
MSKPDKDISQKEIASELAKDVAAEIEDQLSSRLKALLQESIDVESVCELIEQLDLEERINSRFMGILEREHNFRHELMRVLPAMQKLIRELRLDLELTKRALASLGHTGVMARKQMEKQLTLELFPPETPEPGAGIQARYFRSPPGREAVDCRERLDLCRAACCRLFNAYLSPHEIRSKNYEWDAGRPYALVRRNGSCVYLSADCNCQVYDDRPLSCSTYSCRNDKRIWQDFDKRILNPKLKRWLEKENFVPDMDREEPEIAAKSAAAVPEEGSSELSPAHSAPGEKGVGTGEAEHDLLSPDFSELKSRMAPRPRLVFDPKETSPEDRSGD